MLQDVDLSATLFQAAVENSYDLISLLAQDGTILYANPAFAYAIGFSHDDLAGRNAFEFLVHPDDQAPLLTEFSNALHAGRGEVGAYRCRTAEGGWRWFESSGSVISLPGIPSSVVVISRDVTERKLAEETAAQNQFNFQSIFEAIPEGVVIYENNRILNVNPVLLEMLGYTADQVIGRVVWEMIAPEYLPIIHENVRQYRTTPYEVELLRSDGTRLPVEIMGRPYVLSDRIARLVVVRDIRERLQAEAALKSSEERFRQMAENIDEVFWMADAQSGAILYISPAYEKIWGRSCQSLYECSYAFLDAVHEEDREHFLQTMPQHAEGMQQEYRIIRPDGAIRWIWNRTFPIRDENGHIYRLTGISQDITERKEAEAIQAGLHQQLEQQNRRLNDVLLNVPGIVWENDVDPTTHQQKSVFVSGYVEVMLGYTPQEWLESPSFWFSVIHPDDHEAVSRAVADMLARKEYDTLLFRMIAKDGSAVWVESHCMVVRNAQNQVIGVRGVTMDITQRERALEEQQRLIALLEAATDLVGWADAGGFIQYVNPAGRRMLGLDMHAPLEGINIAEFLRNQDLDLMMNVALPTATREGCWFGEVTIFGRDGREVPLGQVITCHKDANGEVRFFSTIARDITEQNLIEADLQRAKEDLEKRVHERTEELAASNHALKEQALERQMAMGALQEAVAAHKQAKEEADLANHAKSEFLSRMSHELRTPLNAILGFGQLLEMAELPPKRRESVRHIVKAGHHLLGLINDVLDISRIEAGNLSLSLEPVKVDPVVREVYDLLHPLSQGARIQLLLDAESLDGYQVMADRQRLKQVLLNLVSNAIKYNRPAGNVKVFAQPIRETGVLRICVRDTGNGLSAKDLSKLFTPFERLDAAKSTIEGTGIGLVLSQRLVEAMEGRIGVESTLGQGSTFWVEFPVADTVSWDSLEQLGEERSTPGNERDDSLPKKSVLYIEDNLPNLELIQMLLEDRGDINLLSAMQASTGLDIAFEHVPDMVLLDLHLPDMDGLEVLKRLRANPATAHIPIVVVSADATAGQIQRLMDAGATAYLTKPIDIRQFMRVLTENLESK